MALDTPKTDDNSDDDVEEIDEDDDALDEAERIHQVRRRNYDAISDRLEAYAQVIESLPEWGSHEIVEAVMDAIQRHARADQGLPDKPGTENGTE